MRNILTIFFILLMSPLALLSQTVKGVVIDKNTDVTLPYAQVLEKGTKNMTFTDEDGKFSITLTHLPAEIVITSMGFSPNEQKITKIKDSLKIKLKINDVALSAVQVVPSRTYDKILLDKIYKNKKNNNPKKIKKLNYTDYCRTSIFIDNLKKETITNSKLLQKQTDAFVSTSDTTVMIPFMINEDVTFHRIDKSKSINKSDLISTKTEALLPGVQKEIENIALNKITTEFNFYNNQIDVLTMGFPSPISRTADVYYNVYLSDSIIIDSVKHYKFAFYPKNYKNITFKGEFWAESKTWAITKIKAILPNEANLNFVSNFQIEVNYQQTKSGKWFYKDQKVNFNLSVIPPENEESNNPYQNFSIQRFNSYIIKDSLQHAKTAYAVADSILEESRHNVPLDTFEQQAYTGIKTLKTNNYIKLTDKLTSFALLSFLNLGPIDIGPYSLFYHVNTTEGTRLSLPIRTSKKFCEFFSIGGYLGYGFKNKEFAYGANINYQIKSNRRTIISANYYKDFFELTHNRFIEFIQENVYQKGSGNIISPITTRVRNPYMIRNTHIDISFLRDLNSNVGFLLRPSYDIYTSTENVSFVNNNIKNNSFTTKSLLFDLRFSHDQKYSDEFFARIYYGNGKPVYHISTIAGKYSFVNNDNQKSDYFLNINASIKTRFNIWQFYFIWLTEAGGTLGDVPYTLLNLPHGTRNLGTARFHYNLLYHASLVSDIYVNNHLTLNTGGILFNKLPLIKKLNLREIFAFKLYYGKLLGNHHKVFDIPDYLHTINVPYMEVSAGITNIFKVFRVEFAYRLNQQKYFNDFSNKWGIRMRFEIAF